MPIMQEICDNDAVGQYVGQVKWFGSSGQPNQARSGYGFITICRGDLKGKDVFVHYSGVRPNNKPNSYRTLFKGEYVQFDIATSQRGNLQAINVTGIDGGLLMCDVVPHGRSHALTSSRA
jgi:cold shock CspA family protein